MKSLALAIILMALPRIGNACSCLELTPSQHIENAEVIFAGRAVKAELIEGVGIKTTFEVARQFKGKTRKLETVLSRRIGSASCGRTYTIGESHVILTNKEREVSACSGYDEYYDAKHDDSKRIDINHRGILKALRQNDKQNKALKKDANNKSSAS